MTNLSASRVVGLPGIRRWGRSTPRSKDPRSAYRTAVRRRRLLGVWRGLCSSTCIVPSRLGRLSALTLLVALVTAASSTLIAQAAQPDVCVMTQQECDQTTRITDCCCLASDASHPSGPIESRVQLALDLSPHPVALPAGTFADTSRTYRQIHISPPPASPPDFTTGSAPLLI
jgi:hypothetical protein